MKVCIRIGFDIELLLCIPNDTRNIDWQVNFFVLASKNSVSQVISIFKNLLEFFLKLKLHIRIMNDFLGHFLVHCFSKHMLMLNGSHFRWKEVAFRINLLVAHSIETDLDIFDVLSSHTVLTIQELDDLFF
jgi:hypothetical protein